MIKDFPAAKKKRAAAGNPGKRLNNPSRTETAGPAPSASQTGAHEPLPQIRELMWKSVGIMRNGKDLRHALEKLRALTLPALEKPSRHDAELRNILALAQLITRSALAREESRGSHYRSDFAYRNDDDFQKHSIVASGKEVRFEP